MRKITAYEIALSALACGIATMFLTVGIYSEIFLLTSYLLASVALTLPLAKQSWRGYALSYISTCILTFIFTSWKFWDLLPFIAFFGLHPLANELQEKHKINGVLSFFVKAAWFDGVLYLIWRFIFDMTTNVAVLDKYIIWFVVVGGTLFFVLYDLALCKCRRLVGNLVKRITK